jgi:AcrR family transcriptional regulator
LADRLGIRAPSLYNHFPDKASLEAALIATGLFELALTLEAALDDAADRAEAVVVAYQGYARRHPHLCRLMTERSLPGERIPDGLGRRAYASFAAAAGGDAARATALRALAHGLVSLEVVGAISVEEADAARRAGPYTTVG